MKSLFLLEKYQSGNPNFGLSPNHSLIAENLIGSNLSDGATFYYDELALQIGQTATGEALLQACAQIKPDLIIFRALGWPNLDPPRGLVQTIEKSFGIKVYMIRGDSVGPAGDAFNQSWFPFVSFIGFIDATLAHLGYDQHPKAIQGLSSFNPRYHYDRKLKKDIDVSFLGSIDRHQRSEYTEFLRDNKINIVTSGGQREANGLTLDEYSTIISRSKISLNFCRGNEGYSQLKGRVFEIMACKTFLLEDDGIETSEFFEEGKDFVMYKTKEELLEKVKFYLKHDEERERIAESGYRKVWELYGTRNVWGYIFNKMGFVIPQRLAEDKRYQQLYQKMESLGKRGDF